MNTEKTKEDQMEEIARHGIDRIIELHEQHKRAFIEWLENSYKTTENHQHIVAQIIAKAYEKL